jgi:hypothetical protein
LPRFELTVLRSRDSESFRFQGFDQSVHTPEPLTHATRELKNAILARYMAKMPRKRGVGCERSGPTVPNDRVPLLRELIGELAGIPEH